MTRSTAALRAHDQLLAEYVADERRAARARGEVPMHHDGTYRTVVRSRLVDGVNLRRCVCSCGHQGAESVDYATALAEANAHRKTHKARGAR